MHFLWEVCVFCKTKHDLCERGSLQVCGIKQNLINRALFYGEIKIPRHITKKNNRTIYKNKKTGRLFPGKSSGLVLAETTIKNSLILLKRRFNINDPIDVPLHVLFLFHFAKEDFFTKKGLVNQKLPDLSNLVQLPEDCLQSAGIIKNDTLIHSLDFSRRLPSNETRLEIFVLKYEV